SEEHYKPQGPNDRVPADPVSVAVALADKIDTLVGFWAIDEKPTGSKDPFALRRAALGVIRIVSENGLRIRLGGLLERLLKDAGIYLATRAPKIAPGVGKTVVTPDQDSLLSFFADRLKFHLRDRGAGHDFCT